MRAESERLVAEHWTEIEAVARELLEFGAIDGIHAEVAVQATRGEDDAEMVLEKLRERTRYHRSLIGP